jgi:hypothetical protein
MYLITYGQFNDVVRQENGLAIPGNIIVPPLTNWPEQLSGRSTVSGFMES